MAVVAAVLALAVELLVANPAVAGGAVRPPVVDRDLPDPALVSDGTRWYLFATNTLVDGAKLNVPMVSSGDLATFTAPAESLPTLGAWARPGFTWAPAPIQMNGHWVLYYTANDAASGRQCIGRASAAAVSGPYTDDFGDPLVCQLDYGGSIDPSPFVDEDGTPWLVWKSDDNAIGGSSKLWSQPLTTDGLNLVGSPTTLLTADAAWESPMIEGPSMVRTGDRTYLFYGGGWWESDRYGIGYATCSGPSGPCEKQTVTGPWMGTYSSGATGPGGPSLLSFGSYALMVFHSWRGGVGYASGGWRAPAVEPVAFGWGPDWQPKWFRGVPGGRVSVTPDGGYVMDRYGEVHAFGKAPPASGHAVWPGWSIARASELAPPGEGGLTLDGWGGLHPFSTGGEEPQIGQGSVDYWPGWDIARDLAVAAWEPARGYVLEGWGGLHPFGGEASANSGPYWPGWDIARAVALDAEGTGGYVLDGWGGLHPFGVGSASVPATMMGGPYWPRWDIARALVLDPKGTGGYVLDGWGGVHAFHAAGRAGPPPVDDSYYVASDVMVDLAITDWRAPSGYTLDRFGNRHPFGDAPTG